MIPKTSKAYSNLVLILLTITYVFNFIDRQILSILMEPNDLLLTDTQLGLLSGLAFALFYTVLDLPIARLADRKNRSIIIGVSLFVWSGMTALTGLTRNFFQLLITRVGVGIGEAGCTPPALSLLENHRL